MTTIEHFARLIDESERIAFFGGAGVSTESGLKDYRSPDGIYRTAIEYGMPPEQILHIDCFESQCELFYRFWRDYFVTDAEPNDAHRALARLEAMGKRVDVITQNIDGLHQRAGSTRVHELHGNASKFHCRRCGREYGVERLIESESVVPYCECGAVIKPRVTLYGEMLDEDVMESAAQAISSADLLIVGGTSLAVWPAASLVRYFHGRAAVVINKETTSFDELASLVFHEGIADVLRNTISLVGITK